MKILIVGGTGMIGGHAALYLQSQGYKVTIAGRRFPNEVPALAELPFIHGNYVQGDFTIKQLANFNAVVFAAGGDVRHVPEGSNPDDYFLQCNGSAVPAFAKLAYVAGVKYFVHVGSVYPHIVPELVDSSAYVRSRKLASDGVTALADANFYACSLDIPYIVGTVPGMKVPMFVAYTQYAEGKIGIPPFAPMGGMNFMSAQSVSEAIAGAIEHGVDVSGKALVLGDENLTFSDYIEKFFRAVGNDVPVPALDKEHPLMPSESLYAGSRPVSYEPNLEEVALLGGYRRGDIDRAITEIVSQYYSKA